ncbi:MAG: hypothetical protein K0B09_15010 [Bacteroidales bacterium]|nr:hypothetical protein [Bacteroidales bacterium]
MDDLLKPYAGMVIRHSTLQSVLSEYQAPNFKIHRWLSEGQLLPLKRSMYVVSPKRSGVPVSLPLIANHLYGPSYVSLEFALSYFGLIPEGVAEITSVTTKRAKTFNNSLARFSYQRLPTTYYAQGIQQLKVSEKISFMIAEPEKALCDWLVLTPNLNIYSTRAMRILLLEDLRLDEEKLSELSPAKIQTYAQAGCKAEILTCLAKYLKG